MWMNKMAGIAVVGLALISAAPVMAQRKPGGPGGPKGGEAEIERLRNRVKELEALLKKSGDADKKEERKGDRYDWRTRFERFAKEMAKKGEKGEKKDGDKKGDGKGKFGRPPFGGFGGPGKGGMPPFGGKGPFGKGPPGKGPFADKKGPPPSREEALERRITRIIEELEALRTELKKK